MKRRLTRRGGFALPAVLAVTGVVTIVFLVAITALASLTAEANAARERVRFMQRALTAEADLTMMAVTEPFSSSGLEIGGQRRVNEFLGLKPSYASGLPLADVELDGRPYRVEGEDLALSLQDQAGLINLSLLDEAGFMRLAGAAGASSELKRSLWPRLQDYIDSDSLETPGGAEESEYADGGPANRKLIQGSEWLSVLGVRDNIEPSKWRALRDDVVADATEGAGNVNTASLNTLEIRFGLTSSEARAVITARERQAILSLPALEALIGRSLAVDPAAIYTYPSGRIAFTLRDARSTWAYRGRLTLSPGDPDQPFWIDQTAIYQILRQTRIDASNVPAYPYAPN